MKIILKKCQKSQDKISKKIIKENLKNIKNAIKIKIVNKLKKSLFFSKSLKFWKYFFYKKILSYYPIIEEISLCV